VRAIHKPRSKDEMETLQTSERTARLSREERLKAGPKDDYAAGLGVKISGSKQECAFGSSALEKEPMLAS
jgi:hypothetical protein